MERDKQEALLDYAEAGSYFEVRSLIEEGVAVNKKNRWFQTPLIMAVKGSHHEVVELLMNSGADIHCCDHHGWTVLHHASHKGSMEIVQLLVNKGVAVNKESHSDQTPLIMAAQGFHREFVELLINSGADINCCDDKGWTALHHASYKGSVKIVQLLVNKGVAINKKNICGQTPLMMAAQESHQGVVELLINLGADVDCCDDKGWTALHHASHKGSVEVVQLLVNKGVAVNEKNHAGETPLLVTYGEFFFRENVFELLINLDVDICLSDNNGMTALHYASLWGRLDLVQCLVNKGAVLDMRDCDGLTPLRFAVNCGEIEIAEYLMKAGADCNLEDNMGESPFNILIQICGPDDLETIKLCIENGAYVKLTDYNKLVGDPLFKKDILQNIEICSQAVINKFNNRDLSLLYKGLASGHRLPHIDKMKIGNRSEMALEVKRTVTHEIQENGFCNVFKIVPITLGILCVKSLEKSLFAFNQSNPLASQNDAKRS